MVARYRVNSQPANWLDLGTSGTIGAPQNDKEWSTNFPYQEHCWDETHAWPPRHKRKARTSRQFQNLGGPLLIRKAGYYARPSSYFNNTIGFSWANVRFVPAGLQGNLPMPDIQDWSTESNADGTAGWNRFRPGRPQASVGQFVGELSRLPSIPLMNIVRNRNNHKRFLAASGSEYLNIQFGWIPFLNDLRDMYKATLALDRSLAQLRKDNGKPVIRGGSVRLSENRISDATIQTVSPFYPVLVSNLQGTHKGTKRTTEDESERVWFKARFRYHINDVESVFWEPRTIAALFGATPSPSLLWELMPWSWLQDWGGNIGLVLSNATTGAADNLAADYSYVMHHRRYIKNLYSEKLLNTGSSASPKWQMFTCSGNRTFEQKMRTASSPFGFGQDPDTELSQRQELILSALGISRIR